MSRPKLPDFQRPPVNEVALSIQFEVLSELRAIHIGELWGGFGKKLFPSVEEQPSIPKQIERFGAANNLGGPQFELLNIPPLPRFLFVSESGNEVIQIQSDRFTYNWRKRREADIYPRYEAIEAKFIEFFGKFSNFLRDEKLGSIKVEQADVTYVNQMPREEIANRIDKVISVFSGGYTSDFLRDPEQVHLALKFILTRETKAIGRLHIDAHGTQTDTPALRLVLVARGKPEGTDIKAATEFLGFGRAAIVKGFASITSREMHKAWGRTDDDTNEK
jgi:uncharacterized protein (TIGR04255 family)